ncbi:threonylcarbamoyladenosine tRNA methylthiotransferase-like [Neltuma alba]|nr:threonylcarbamoyladenosine tRNA methylthiotransferase-like [Prosopis alba]
MEDIEDLLIGSGDGSPPGFRLPVTSVGMNPKKNRNKGNLSHKLSQIHDSTSASSLSPKIPGTQTIFIKTFGCSHNQSDSEYMAGQLLAFGYTLSDNPEEADLWLINT